MHLLWENLLSQVEINLRKMTVILYCMRRIYKNNRYQVFAHSLKVE